jgi:GH15 family glucan-1,4-alpha-glucosidase
MYWKISGMPKKKLLYNIKGSRNVDASMLLMPVVNFISPYSKYWESTIKAIQADLVSDVLVYRYKSDDDTMDALKGKEGTFTICSLWYVQWLAKGGETEKAKMYFEKLLSYSNHLGLFAEQISVTGEHLGNFPQAFTHLSLMGQL